MAPRSRPARARTKTAADAGTRSVLRLSPSQPAARALSLVRGDANEPLLLLHLAFRAVTRGPDALLARHGFGRVHHRVLFFVGRDPGLRVVDLQGALGVSKQALHGPLRELLKAKLVDSRPAPDDARERRLHLTAAGRALEAKLSGQQRKRFEEAFRRAGTAAAWGWYQVMVDLAQDVA